MEAVGLAWMNKVLWVLWFVLCSVITLFVLFFGVAFILLSPQVGNDVWATAFGFGIVCVCVLASMALVFSWKKVFSK